MKTSLNQNKGAVFATRAVAYTGIMTALVYVCTLLGISTPQFYFNLGDSVILIAAALFNPVIAMIAGGLGAFFADLTVYPATMLFTLFIKAIEGLVAGLLLMLIRRAFKNRLDKLSADRSKEAALALKKLQIVKIVCSAAAMLFSAALMMTGYFICQTFFYGTMSAAVIALPMDAVQAVVSCVLATVVLYVFGLEKFRDRLKLTTPFKTKRASNAEENATSKQDIESEQNIASEQSVASEEKDTPSDDEDATLENHTEENHAVDNGDDD